MTRTQALRMARANLTRKLLIQEQRNREAFEQTKMGQFLNATVGTRLRIRLPKEFSVTTPSQGA